MSINFPNGIDNFTTVDNETVIFDVHPNLHNDINDAVEAIETVIGVTNSTDPQSLRYKVSALEGDAFSASDFTPYFDSNLATKSTTDLTEGTNLYYTTGRFNSNFATKTTTDLAEGTNLYYTDARVQLNSDVVTAKNHAVSTGNPHSTTMTSLTDVNISGQQLNDFLIWNGTKWANSQVTVGLQLGETSTTAYRGDRGKTAYDHSLLTSGNPHNVTKSDVGLGNVLDVAQIPATDKGAANGVATLDASSKIPQAQLPAIAITDTFTANSQAAMLALSTAEKGDVCVRTDLNKSFILTADPYSTLGNWQELLTPTDTVLSVNGNVGAVTIDKTSVGLGNVDNTADANKNVLSATKLTTARLINGTSFDGSANIVNNFPQGFLINGKIVRTVASNNLTVAIKTLAGIDPSATDPVYCRIGNTVRTLTAALSVTLNAGTNWFNSGSAELAAKEIDYFVYLGWNGTSIVLSFARIPYGVTIADFAGTTTNEKYCANQASYFAGNELEVVGRFNATLSAGASYNWSIPATDIIINRPIYETRWLDWTTTLAGFSATSQITGKYKIHMDNCEIAIREFTGTSNATTFTCTMPFATANINHLVYIPVFVTDNSANPTTPGVLVLANNTNTHSVYKTYPNGTWTSSGTKNFYGICTTYRI